MSIQDFLIISTSESLKFGPISILFVSQLEVKGSRSQQSNLALGGGIHNSNNILSLPATYNWRFVRRQFAVCLAFEVTTRSTAVALNDQFLQQYSETFISISKSVAKTTKKSHN